LALGQQTAPKPIYQDVIGGLVGGISGVVLAVTFAGLLFSGGLAEALPRYIGLSLFGTALVTVLLSLFGTYPAIVTSPQDFAPVILTTLVTGIAVSGLGDAGVATAIAGVAVATLTTGTVFALLGQFQLGRLIRYIPYPVIGGFLAGTGWVLFVGGLTLTTGIHVESLPTAQFLSPDVLARWLPGLFYSVFLLWVTRRFNHFLVWPIALIGGIVTFYGIGLVLGSQPADLIAAGWALGPFPEQTGLTLLSTDELAQVDWSFLSSHANLLFPVIVVSAIALLLNINGLELITAQDIDENRELKIAGFANMAAAFTGVTTTFHGLSATGLAHAVGATRRLTGLVTAGLMLSVVIFGLDLLAFMPRAIIGGLSMLLGLQLLIQWAVQSWRRLPKFDYALILLILIIIALFGFLQGVGLGILMAALLFLLSYSRTNVVKHSTTGNAFSSSLTRTRQERQLLGHGLGQKILILQLHGYIFFGTAVQLVERIRAHLDEQEQGNLCFVVLDFKGVTGIDSSVAMSFEKLAPHARQQPAMILTSGFTDQDRSYLSHAGVYSRYENIFRDFNDVDRAVEWCEDQLLSASQVQDQLQPLSVADQLSQLIVEPDVVIRLLPFLEKVEVQAGERIIRQGADADDIFFIESGRVTAQFEFDDLPPYRLQTMTRENVVGEIAYYLRTRRTASVVADEPSILFRLDRKSIRRLAKEDPRGHAMLHELLARLIAERVAHLTGAVRALRR
jgi:SulP family sulfate permease